MTFTKSTVSLFCTLLCSGSLSAALLGDMTVRSLPGEPLDAILAIEDVDLSSAPSMVRIAPPGTYLREGVAWPEQAQDLRVQRDTTSPNRVTVRVVGRDTVGNEGFPLLVELNVGGQVSVRQYDLRVENGRFAVVADAPRTTVTAPVPKAVSEEKRVTVAQTAQKPAAQTTKRAAGKKGRYAPTVVREYVALNGFDSTQPFPVQEDMTIWSIAKLYWPAFEGCTMEQLVVGFEEKNPDAFMKDDVSKLVIGSQLTAPTRREVLAIDPVAAFRRVHGPDMVIPMPTQNLIDAQAMSLETAELAARAQAEAKARGGDPATVAAAGRAAIEAERARATEARAMMGEERPGMAPGASAVAAINETSAASAADSSVSTDESTVEAATAETAAGANAAGGATTIAADDAADASVTADTLHQPADPALTEDVKTTSEEKPKAEPAAQAPKTEKVVSTADASAASVESKTEGSSFSAGGVAVGVLILLLAAWFLRRKQEEPEAEPEKPAQTVTISKDIPPTSAAQLKALETTVDEAVKNGTTAGAMGAGAAAFATARAEEEKASVQRASPKEVVPDVTGVAPSGASSAIGVTQSAETVSPVGSTQPWLEPDDEMPPVSGEEKSRASDKKVSDVVGGLTLDLDEPEEPEAAPVVDLPPASEPEPKGIRSEREVAQTAAIDGKLKLASAFVGLGALKEARELLAEVKAKGTPAQRERAQFLEDRIGNGDKA